MRLTGKWLNRQYRLGAKHARYREDGIWYHPLERFPGVLFDRGGYVRFETESDYLNATFVKHGPNPKHIHLVDGLAGAPGYVTLDPPPREFE